MNIMDPEFWKWQSRWPKEYGPLPTDEEYAAAEKLYRADCEFWMEKGDVSDFNMGLEFVMCTYGPITWIHFFGYEMKVQLPQQ